MLWEVTNVIMKKDEREDNYYTTPALMYEKDRHSSVHNGTRVTFFFWFVFGVNKEPIVSVIVSVLLHFRRVKLRSKSVCRKEFHLFK